MSWLDWLFPPHECSMSRMWNSRTFRCNECGEIMSGDDLFHRDNLLGRYWRANNPKPDWNPSPAQQEMLDRLVSDNERLLGSGA